MKKSLIIFIMIWAVNTLLISQSADKVFYSSFRPQGWDIHLSVNNGDTFSAITTHESLDYDARISPNGNWIVFTSERNGPPQLYIKNIEGDTLPRLLVNSNSMQDQVDFSPDGKSIVFVSTHEGNADIYRLPFSPKDTLDISQAQNITNNGGGDFRPKYSHDGKTIAFCSDRDHETKPHPFLVFAMQRTGDVYSIPSNGGKTTRLTDSNGWDGSPVWSTNDQEIYFYSDRNGTTSLFKMNNKGEHQEAIGPESLSCVSPAVSSDNTLLFTSMNEEKRAFSILGFNLKSQVIDSSLVQDFDMFNADYHSNGIIVFHGNKRPEDNEINKAGFSGDLLIKNSPESALLIDRPIDLFGVRRAFAAPPSFDGSKVVYSFNPARSPMDWLQPSFYPLALLPLLAMIWFLFGIISSIKKRKVIPFWKYLCFSIISLLVVAGIGSILFNKFVVSAISIYKARFIALIIFGTLVGLAFLARFYFKKRASSDKAVTPLFKHYYLLFLGYAIVLLYLAAFLGSFFNVQTDFYAVDFKTNEVEHLFEFKPDPNFNPFLVRIIDTKFTPDGEYLQFTVGGFRENTRAQACIYRYNLGSNELERITDLDNNNGFADFSKDNSSMVYRSGHTGNMDIYLKDNNNLINLTNSPAKETFPVISYDGNMIAYCSDATGVDKDGKVITMDIFTSQRQSDDSWSEPKQITTYSGQEGHPHFSPDGKWIIFTTEEYGINDEQPLVQPYIFSPQMYGEITAIRLDDGKQIRLTHNKWEDGAPLWITGN